MRTIVLAKTGVHALALAPLAWLVLDVVNQSLGVDPVAEITHRSGDWALRLLLCALALTPLRRISGWNMLARFRRLIGLYAFFYASLHLATYVVLDLGGYWPQIIDDLVKRPYITVGFLAWLGLLALALTSSQAAMRRLGRNWVRLHRIVYLIGALGVLHYVWLVKADLREPLLYAGVLALLLGLRLPPIARRIGRRGWSNRTQVAQRGP
jgi:sulfoxide reductase heme-binding subunit YedZ